MRSPNRSQKEAVKEAVLGEKLEKIDSPESVKKIVDALHKNDSTLDDCYEIVKNHIENDIPEDKSEELKTRTHALVIEAIEDEKKKIEQKIMELEPKTDAESVALKESMERLLSFENIDRPIWEEKEKIKKAEQKDLNPEQKEVDEFTSPAQIKAAKEYWDKVTDEYGEVPEDPLNTSIFIDGREIKNGKIKTRYAEFREFVDNKEKILEDIRNNVAKYAKEKDFKKRAKDMLKKTLENASPSNRALMLYSLDAANLKEAVENLAKILEESVKGRKDVVKNIDVVFVNIEEKLKRIAERIADERLDREMKEIGPQSWKQLYRVDKFAAKWWKRNAMEGYREKYVTDITKRLKEDPKYRTELMKLDREEVKPGYFNKLKGNTPEESTREELNTDLDAIAERFGMSWAEKEDSSYLTSNESIANQPNEEIQKRLGEMCVLYAEDKITEDQFRKALKKEIIPQIQSLQDPPNEEVIAYLKSEKTLLEDATEADIEKAGLLDKLNAHKKGLIALDLDNLRINIALGKAQNVDVKTKVRDLNWMDRYTRKGVEYVQKNKLLGRFVNPATVAVVGYGLGNITAQIAANQWFRYGTLATVGILAPSTAPAIAAIATGCLLGGAFSYLRQNKENLYMKAQKERREALNIKHDEDEEKSPGTGILNPRSFERRLEKGERLYFKTPVAELVASLDVQNTPDEDTLRANLAKAIVLNEVSEVNRVDLIKWDGELTIESQRLMLLRAIAEGKVRLKGMNPLTRAEDLNEEVEKAKTYIFENNIKVTEKNFNRFKTWENLKAAGTGAVLGGSISALGMLIGETVQTKSHTETVTTPGKAPEVMNAGIAMKQEALLKELSTHGLDQSKITFDSSGHLTPTAAAYLKGHNVNLHEITVAGNKAPSLDTIQKDGFEKIKHIHFNDNQPHAPGKHILDELRFMWKGKPEIGSDGKFHFSVKGMFDQTVPHSRLPNGVSMPSDPTQLKIGMEVKVNGVNHWRFFSPDSNGDIALPPEFFDASKVGHVGHGGNTLPGLRSNALAVGFNDSNGTFQVMSSVKGHGGYTPKTMVEFMGDIKAPPITTAHEVIDSQQTVPGAIPVLAGAPMKHLEYGKKKKTAPNSPGEGHSPSEPALPGEPEKTPYNQVEKDDIATLLEKRGQLVVDGKLSDSVKQDPSAKLDFKKEYSQYFDSLKNNDPDRYEDISGIASKIKLSPQTESIVSIPCYVKEPNLSRTLENYANQTNKNFEIVICLNGGPMDEDTDKSREQFRGEVNNRMEEIRKIKAKYPDLKIHAFNTQFPDRPNIGQVRGLLSQIVCLSAANAGIEDPIIISNDADNYGLSSKYIESFTRKFKDNEDLDYILGQIEWDADAKNPDSFSKKCPELFMGQRVTQITDAIIRWKSSPKEGKNIGSSGANTAIRAKSYLAVGGYDDNWEKAEDVILGRRLRLMRYDGTSSDLLNKKHQSYSPSARLQTSPRRALSTIVNNYSFPEQWHDFENKLGAGINDKDISDLYAKDGHLVQTSDIEAAAAGDEKALTKIKTRMEYMMEKTFSIYGMRDTERITQILKRMGIKTTVAPKEWKYEINDEDIITSIKGIDIDMKGTNMDNLYRFFGLSAKK